MTRLWRRSPPRGQEVDPVTGKRKRTAGKLSPIQEKKVRQQRITRFLTQKGGAGERKTEGNPNETGGASWVKKGLS